MYIYLYSDINNTYLANESSKDCDDCFLKNLHMKGDYRIMLAIVLASIAALSIFWNIILLVVILKKRQLRSLNNAFVVNLAVSDLVIVIFYVPMEVDAFLHGYHRFGFRGCQLKNSLFFLSLPVSSYGLMLLTTERYVRIKYALRYDSIVTHGRVCVVLSLNWTYNLLMGSFAGGWAGTVTLFSYGKCNAFLTEWYKYYVLAGNLLVPTSILIVLNIALFITANRKSNSVSSLQLRSRGLRRRRSPIANIKAAKTISLLLGAFIICWIPYTSMVVINTVCQIPCYVKFRPILKALNVVNYSNSLWNPLLYGLCNKNFRKEIIELLQSALPCKKQNKRNSNSTSSAPLWHMPETKVNDTVF